ncbi:MAG: DUF502 domain-containing protein [Haloferacaceae archaeon]
MVNVLPHSDRAVGGSIRRTLRQSFIRGVALTIPLIVTLLVFGFAVRSLSRVVVPVVEGVALLLGVGPMPTVAMELAALLLLFWFVIAVGFVAERRTGRESRLGRTVDDLMARVPGLGSIYTGVQRLSSVLLSKDTESFREVKLLEFPDEGSYMLCYVTARPPATVREGAGTDEMVTLFVPLAPNPVMGGFLVYAPTERVHDVDLTVEESMQAIITSGVAIDPNAAVDPRLDRGDSSHGFGDGNPV